MVNTGEGPEPRSKHVSQEELYSLWASTYDKYPNVALRLEEQVLSKLLSDVRGKKVLDLGAGTGRWSIVLTQKGAKVTAVEPSPQMRQVMETKLRKLDLLITMVPTNIEGFESNEQYDFILLSFVLNHIDDLKPALSKVANLLLPNGQLIISENPPEFSRERKYGFQILEGRYEVPFYRHTPKEITQVAKEVGLRVVEQRDLIVDESVRELFEQKPLKKFEDYKGTRRGIVYVLEQG